MAPTSTAATDSNWEDVTSAFAAARESMAAGDMIHTEGFTLFSAMSTIELMDPKMDVGCGPVRDIDRIETPLTLTDRQVINIMDHLLACEATWLEAHTLSQTVFSCVYAHRLEAIPSVELFSYLRVQLATMGTCIDVILDEKVAEEEDFVYWTSPFNFQDLSFRSSAEEDLSFEQILADARAREPLPEPSTGTDADATDAAKDNDTAAALIAAVAMRLDFRLTFHRIIRDITAATAVPPPPETDDLLEHAQQVLAQWQACPFRAPVDDALIAHLFDASINRHKRMPTPPRTAKLMSVDAALAYFQRILGELRAALALRDAALRPAIVSPSRSPSSSQGADDADAAATASPMASLDAKKPTYSLQVALFALENFGALHNPRILTRSVLSRLLIPQRSVALFADPAALIPAMFRVDMKAVAARDDALSPELATLRSQQDRQRGGNDGRGVDGADKQDGDGNGDDDVEDPTRRDALQEGVTCLFDCMLRNRSRLRRQLLRVLQLWDQFAELTTRKAAHISPNGKELETNSAGVELGDRATGEETEVSEVEDTAQEHGNQNGAAADSSVQQQQLPSKSLSAQVAYEICCRYMALHWLLGFEVELYQDFEFVAVYFYVGYVLTCLGVPVLGSGERGQPQGRGGRVEAHSGVEVHPARQALARLDDGRRWLCRALSTFLYALSDSPRFSYSCERGVRYGSGAAADDQGEKGQVDMFGCDELWFEQRFGAMRGMTNGPGYAGHELFKSYARLQEESLFEHATDMKPDIGLLRLEEAARGFQKARLLLGRAKKMAERCESTFIAEEAWRLATVAVQNSVAVASAITNYKDGRTDRMSEVSFCFSKHKHFAIVRLQDKT